MQKKHPLREADVTAESVFFYATTTDPQSSWDRRGGGIVVFPDTGQSVELV
ncbi:Uncharacterised protein [Citrobacter freundii]|nr:Uncharacterised protein [Citrobacter freundii]